MINTLAKTVRQVWATLCAKSRFAVSRTDISERAPRVDLAR
jgi:hypothetical protein